jgi:4-hydroxybenzoate polyprenyltransferase/phosphoserine phosphatase
MIASLAAKDDPVTSRTPSSKTEAFPLVVDLDGTLTPTDTLAESILKLIKRRPLSLVILPFWLMKGRSVLKARVAEFAQLTTSTLPLREGLIDYLTAEKARGRTLMLATAAHRSIAEPIARRLGLFDDVLASDEHINLKGKTKLAAIQAHYPHGFVYAGDSRADLPIWAQAKGAILAGAAANVSAKVRSTGHVEREFLAAPAGGIVWMRALRLHQCAKNLLLFVPVLTGFAFEPSRVISALMAFLAFSLVASATYLINDLWDLDSDRVHPRKCLRPFASGSISIVRGIAVATLLLLTGFSLAATVSLKFAAMLALYLVLTSAYSWSLKRYVLIDVLMLAVLYTLRIVAGSVAVDVPVSSWLLAFSVFAFLSLALVKRCSELVSLGQIGMCTAHGRDYRASDLTVLWPLGCASSIASVVVFGLFISTPETGLRYPSHELLWLVGFALIYWEARLWIKTSRGEMHDDPLVFAIRDFGSRITIAAMLAMMMLARFTY